MPYFLAVDAGGTKTEFLLADENRELARVRTGTIKRMRAGAETTLANLRKALHELESLTAVSMDAVTQTCIGTAGESVPLVAEWLQSSFESLVGGELLLLGDVEIALDACFHGGRGVLVLAGTGSNVAGRATTGTIFTAGGWGPALADQGSGHFIGLESLRRGFLALDQARTTRLLDLAIEHWQLPSRAALIEHANANPAPDFSALTPRVVQCAAEGDVVAQDVLHQAGHDLASLAGLVIERVRNLEPESATAFVPPPVAVAGSVLEKIAPVRDALAQSLRILYPTIQLVDAAADPVSGALWRARRGN